MPQLHEQRVLNHRAKQRRHLSHQQPRRLGDLQLRRSRAHNRGQRGVPHDFGGVRKTFGEHPHDLHHLIGIQPMLDEPLGVCSGFTVGAHVHNRIGVVDSSQTDGALHTLQQRQVNVVSLADLAG